MTEIAVKLDPETGAATVELRGAAVTESRFRLRDIATEKYLTRRGWSKTPAYLPGEAVTAADFTVLVIDADLSRRISSGMNLSLEQPASNVFASISWPDRLAAVPDEETVAPEDQNEPGTDADGDETADAAPTDTAATDDDDAMAAAADAEAARLMEDAADAGDDPPASLEPAIREEASAPYRSEPPLVAAAPRISRETQETDNDDDEEERGLPWGRLAAAALFFMVLGSALTYFWQSSAYDNDLRVAMRAVEAQRDREKADFDQRLADAQAAAATPGDGTVTAESARVAELTSQAADLTSDRDAALAEVSEQQARVKALEERLSTAQGEIESLKVAATADADEENAVLNQRIDALGVELETARNALEATRTELAARDQAVARSDEELKAARAEVAALKKSAEERQSAQGEEIEERIRALSAQLDKTTQDLATRDASLRDVQSRLSVANVQIEALKQVAGKATEADLERTTLADRITELGEQIDKADRELAAKDAELVKARTSLDAANTLLEANAAELEKLRSAPVAASVDGAQPDDSATARLRQERDIFAQELKAMTESFNALKAERDRLAEAAGKADQQTASLETPSALGDSRAVWGATAIDQTGAVYSIQNQIAEKSASDNVVALCRGKSNGRCEPLRSYSNSCFSLARIEGEGPRNDNFGFSVNKDWQSAESGAVRQCEELGGNCTIRFTACSPDTLSKPAVNQ